MSAPRRVRARTASDWALGYRMDNSRSEVLTRQIVFVGEGQGDYDADGDYLGPGQGDYDVALAGTDSLVATTGVRAELHWRQGFRFLGADRWYGAWSVQTTGSVEGRNTTDDVGGLLALRPDVLFDPETAVLADVSLGEEVALPSGHDMEGKPVVLRLDLREVAGSLPLHPPEVAVNRLHPVQDAKGLRLRHDVIHHGLAVLAGGGVDQDHI